MKQMNRWLNLISSSQVWEKKNNLFQSTLNDRKTRKGSIRKEGMFNKKKYKIKK